MPTVVGLFNSQIDAENAVQGLVAVGFERFDVSLMVVRAAETTRQPGEENVNEKNVAGTGAAFGGMVGVLVGAGMMMVPGIGPVLGAGPLVAALAGGAAGAASGGIAAAMVGQGLAEDEAEYFVEGLRRGGTLVAVRCHTLAMGMAAETMRKFEAVDVSCRVGQRDEAVGKWASGGRKEGQPFGEMLEGNKRRGDSDDVYGGGIGQKGEEGRGAKDAENSEERTQNSEPRSQKSKE